MKDVGFKLDEWALWTALRNALDDGAGAELLGQAARTELARQLRDHGAPDAPFEEQQRALLVAFTALQQAGEEMPSVDEVVTCVFASDGGGFSYQSDAVRILDHFRPIFARLTQERGEARARSKARAQAASKAAAASRKEIDALRQRAERAEREIEFQRTRAEDIEKIAEGQVETERALRARVAELEAILAKACDYEATAAEVRAARTETGADVVERLIQIYERAADESSDAPPLASGAGFRAVLAHLAAMGEEALPEGKELAGLAKLAHETHWANPGNAWGIVARAVIERWQRSRLSPVIGALRARVAELEATLAVAVEAERDACAKIALDIFIGNTEIPRKDAPAWFACAEFINDEIRNRP